MKVSSLALAFSLGVAWPASARDVSQPDSPKTNDVCLDADHIDHTGVIDDSTVLFYMRGGKVWKNTLRAPCSSLTFERAFSWETYGQVCSNRQMIRVMRTGTRCSLGAFTVYAPQPAKGPAQ